MADLFVTFGLPLFNDTSTLLGYIDCIRNREINSGHAHSAIGCALVLAGHLSEACPYLAKARDQYTQHSVPGYGRPQWTIEGENRMTELLNAIESNDHQRLLEDWYHQSVRSLRLDKKWKV